MEHSYRPLEGPAKAASGMLAVVCVMHMVAIWLAYRVMNFVSAVEAGEDVSEETALRIMSNAEDFEYVYYGALLFCVITFLIWFHRAYKNLGALAEYAPVDHRAGEAVYSWFVPIWNLFRPYQIACEIWSTTARDDEAPTRGMGLVKAWWATWIIGGIVGRVVLNNTQVFTLSDAAELQQKVVVVSVIQMVAGVLAILVVQRITQRTSERMLARARVAAD